MLTIVVGVDGSEGSERAVEWCAAMAPLLDAEIVAVHASRSEDEQLASQQQLDAWCAPILVRGGKLRRVVADEDPLRLLQAVAEGEHADLIVVGASHRGELGGLLFGSVVDDLVHHGLCPVVVVPAEATGAGA